MSDTPALTPEEWASGEAERGEHLWLSRRSGLTAGWSHDGVPLAGMEHAVAALCLYGQPFGFTQEDVELLREAMVLDHYDGTGIDIVPGTDDKLSNLAARIAALLPPSP